MTDTKGRPNRGQFLDLRTLASALTDRSYSLESACQDFAVEHGKQKAEKHGVVTAEYVDYNRRDVKATGELLVKLLEEFERHPISLQVTKAFSAASIAKSYERAMGIKPVLARQPDFPREILGYAMNAFFGGRAECRTSSLCIRRSMRCLVIGISSPPARSGQSRPQTRFGHSSRA
jgi:hypothetical protein